MCALLKVQLCVKVLKRVQFPQPQLTPASFSCPPSMDGYHTTVHQTGSFTSTSCHCSSSLFLILFVIIRWQKRCRLSASDWLLDIESGEGRDSLLFRVRPLILLAGGSDGGVVKDGGCAPVSAPELYPFLSITVQVKQMIGFSQ